VLGGQSFEQLDQPPRQWRRRHFLEKFPQFFAQVGRAVVIHPGFPLDHT
jgi:hypothetical protein